MSDLRIESIRHCFSKKEVLKDVSLQVPSGTLLSLLGPSGCGKTTLLKSIAGLLEPVSGKIWIGSKEVTTLPSAKRKAVVVFQDYRLFPHMNVWDNLTFGLRMQRCSLPDILEKTHQMLELIDLQGQENQFPHQLSGGQQQRVALGRALLTDPEVLLLDEPFSSLDTSLRSKMRTFVRSLQEHTGVTTLLVTHDREEAMMISDAIAVMDKGEILQTGAPATLYQRPCSRPVAELFGERNYISADTIRLLGMPSDLENTEWMLLPEHIFLDLTPFAWDESWVCWCGQIESAQFAGERTWYRIQALDRSFLALGTGLLFSPGARVTLRAQKKDFIALATLPPNAHP